MMRAFQIGGVLLLMAVAGPGAQKGSPKAALRPGAPPSRAMKENSKGVMKGNGLKKAGGGAPRMMNPANPVERLMAMPPEQRERVIEKFPPERQAQLRQRLEQFDKLPPAERARRLRMFETFSSLPPEKQEILQHQLQAFNSLPDDRRTVLRPALQRLRGMPDSDRRALLNREEFKNRFTPAELQMLSDISENYPLPGR